MTFVDIKKLSLYVRGINEVTISGNFNKRCMLEYLVMK